MTYYFWANFLIGSCLASHACVIYERLEKGEDFCFSRSKCPYCGFELGILDEIPLLSYLFLKGKCRYCRQEIPLYSFVFEAIGALSFLKIDFSRQEDILTAFLFFCLLLAAIYDEEEQEFPLLLLLGPTAIIICAKSKAFFLLPLSAHLEMLIISLLLIYFTIKEKMGLGDLLIYLIIALYFSPHFANLTLLLASSLLLGHYLLERRFFSKSQIAFVPYIYLAMVLIYNFR